MSGFGERLRNLRGNQSKKAFAQMLGVSPQNYQYYESGRIPEVKRLTSIASVLGVSVDYLLGITPDPAPTSSTTPTSPPIVRESRTPYGTPSEVVAIIKLIPDDGLQGTFNAANNSGQFDIATRISYEIALRNMKKDDKKKETEEEKEGTQ